MPYAGQSVHADQNFETSNDGFENWVSEGAIQQKDEKMGSFEKVRSIEPVTDRQLQSLIQAMGSIAAPMILDLGNVDLKAGRGVLEGHNRCLWTKSGHRITISLSSDGGVIGSLSSEIDPDKPGVSN